MEKRNAMSKDRLVIRYINLAYEYVNIPHGIGWKPEYLVKEKKLKTEMLEIRKELGI